MQVISSQQQVRFDLALREIAQVCDGSCTNLLVSSVTSSTVTHLTQSPPAYSESVSGQSSPRSTSPSSTESDVSLEYTASFEDLSFHFARLSTHLTNVPASSSHGAAPVQRTDPPAETTSTNASDSDSDPEPGTWSPIGAIAPQAEAMAHVAAFAAQYESIRAPVQVSCSQRAKMQALYLEMAAMRQCFHYIPHYVFPSR